MNSQIEGFFSLMAELGFVLAGFSAVAMSLRNRDGSDWPPAARIRAQGLLVWSIIPALLSLLALGLSASGVRGDLVFRVVSVLCAALGCSFAWRSGRASRALAAASETSIANTGLAGQLLFWAIVPLALLQVVNLVALGSFWPTFVGLTHLLVFAVYVFGRLMFVDPR